VVLAVVFLAWRSPAFPLALAAVPAVVIGAIGTNPFPEGAVKLFGFLWLVLAMFFLVIRGGEWLAFQSVFSLPVIASLLLGGILLWRLGDSPATFYGELKVQLFFAANVTLLLAGILVARNRRDFELYLALALLVAAAGALVLLRDLLQGTAEPLLGGRFAISEESHPIQLGRGSAEGIILAAYFLLTAKRVWLRALGFACLPILAISLFASGSRGPLVGLVAALLVLVAGLLADPQARRRLVLLGAGAVAAALLIPQLVPGQDVERALGVFLGGAAEGLSSSGRIELWSLAWSAFLDHPLLGLGTGGFAVIAPVYLYPHNLVLEVAAELGVVGLAALALFLAAGLRIVTTAWRRAVGLDRTDIVLVAALLASALVNAMVSGDIQNNAALWLRIGLAAGIGLRVAAPALTPELATASGAGALRRVRRAFGRPA
jgi:O-antigen ligase